MLEIMVLLGALVFVGLTIFTRNHAETKPAVVPVPAQSGPQVGDRVPYADKRTGNFKGSARIERFRHDGLITLRHSDHPCARPFSVSPTRILERS